MKRARYGDGSLYQRGNVWHVRYREVRHRPGGAPQYIQHRESTHSADREYAARFLRSKLQKLGGRRRINIDPEQVRYEDLRENWITEARSAKKKSLRNNNIATGHLDRFFAGWRAIDITIADLKRYRAERVAAGVSEHTVNRDIAWLRRMFTIGVRDELIDSKPGYFPMTPESNEAVDAIYIEREQYSALRERLKEPVRSLICFCFWTGIRLGEARKLRWSDYQRKTILLPGVSAKTGRARAVFVPDDFKLKPSKPEELIFPVSEDEYRAQFKKACVSLGYGQWQCIKCEGMCKKQVCPSCGPRRLKALRYVGILPRFTRHTAIRNMDDAGIPRDRAKAISGHRTDAMYTRYNIGKDHDAEMVYERLKKAYKQY